MRERRSKWYVSKHEWPHAEYPPYCSGLAFILTPDVAVATLASAPHMPYFWVDDLYITGLLAQKIGFKHHNIRTRYELNLDKFEAFYMDAINVRMEKSPIFTHARSLPISRLYRLWEKIVAKAQSDTRWRISSGG